MTRVADWCIAHRRRVVVVWVAVAIVATALAGLAGNRYATNFTLPGTESQHASDLLKREFRAQSGDVDTIVFRVPSETIDTRAVRAAIGPMLARVATIPPRCRSGQSLQPAGRSAGLVQSDVCFRDDQLRQAGQPAPELYGKHPPRRVGVRRDLPRQRRTKRRPRRLGSTSTIADDPTAPSATSRPLARLNELNNLLGS
jgi:hypothetical protein